MPGLKILSCGAGMQSTALALMSCENKKLGYLKHQHVPIYDYIIFCDLGQEADWVYDQVRFIETACEDAGIKFIVLETDLYNDYKKNFGNSRVVAIPWWTINPDGKRSKIAFRTCTIEYKIAAIERYIRYKVLGYRFRQRTRPEDIKNHEMHIGFSFEELKRCKENPRLMFVNKFPLVDMGVVRADNYAYILEVWGLKTKGSACLFCPFHQNYFFKYIKEHQPDRYKILLEFDEILESQQPKSKIKSKLFISRSRKRVKDLEDDECADAQTFPYKGVEVWNGF